MNRDGCVFIEQALPICSLFSFSATEAAALELSVALTFKSFSTNVLLFCAIAAGVTSVDNLLLISPNKSSGGQSFTCHLAFFIRFRLFVLQTLCRANLCVLQCEHLKRAQKASNGKASTHACGFRAIVYLTTYSLVAVTVWKII